MFEMCYFEAPWDVLRQLHIRKDVDRSGHGLNEVDQSQQLNDHTTVQAYGTEMAMLREAVDRLGQSAVDKGAMAEMGYFAALGEVIE